MSFLCALAASAIAHCRADDIHLRARDSQSLESGARDLVGACVARDDENATRDSLRLAQGCCLGALQAGLETLPPFF